jgi:hypothetical protein
MCRNCQLQTVNPSRYVDRMFHGSVSSSVRLQKDPLNVVKVSCGFSWNQELFSAWSGLLVPLRKLNCILSVHQATDSVAFSWNSYGILNYLFVTLSYWSVNDCYPSVYIKTQMYTYKIIQFSLNCVNPWPEYSLSFSCSSSSFVWSYGPVRTIQREVAAVDFPSIFWSYYHFPAPWFVV